MIPMRVCFLDIDGPLSPHGTNGSPEDLEGFFRRDIVQMLDLWLSMERDVQVVLSSSWRNRPGMEPTRRTLAAVGLTHPVVDATPFWRVGGGWDEPAEAPRGETIRAWLRTHPEVTHGVILDDAPLDELKPLTAWVVRVSPRTGLNCRNLQRASEILRRPFPRTLFPKP